MFRLPNKNQGFTLIELLIVVTITMFLISMLGIGLYSLRNSITLDNSIRDLKIEIQNAQNEARNSFIVDDLTRGQGSLDQRKLAVGVLLNIKPNTADANQVLLTKMTVYFSPTGAYNLDNLRTDIKALRNLTNLSCDTITTITFAGSVGNLKCIAENTNNTKTINNIRLKTSSTGIALCNQSSNINLFFTAGYGEAVLPVTNGDCQISIESAGRIASSRAIKVSKDGGAMGTCGDYCASGKPPVNEAPIPGPRNPTPVPLDNIDSMDL